ILMGARRDGRAVVIEVADRGPGLAPGDEERVFEKFYRGAAGSGELRTGGAPGVGLGLAICRAIVAAHGGDIRAANRPGGGTSFRIPLPLEAEPPAVPPEEVESAQAPPAPAPETA